MSRSPNNGMAGIEMATPSGSEEPKGAFYAVFLPTTGPEAGTDGAAPDPELPPLTSDVFSSFPDALKVVKRFKKERQGHARFKSFADERLARAFADGTLAEDSLPPSASRGTGVADAGEESSPYTAPSRPQLTQLKKAIEANDLDKFTAIVDDNPRYLINASGDVPTIVFEGCRYNALHLAAKCGATEIAAAVLGYISDPQFVAAIFPASSCLIFAEAQASKLLDYYLNTPDKGFQETPLHFASKLGFADIVALLADQPQAELDARNKRGETAADIACSKSKLSGSALSTAKADIAAALARSRHWVPLFRSSAGAVVGAPAAAKPPLCSSDGRSFLAAVAGPLDADAAARLRDAWAKPKDALAKLRCSDAFKGMERVGRRLAKTYDCEWTEFWSFLDSYADAGSASGLATLEDHLARRLTRNPLVWSMIPEHTGPFQLSDPILIPDVDFSAQLRQRLEGLSPFKSPVKHFRANLGSPLSNSTKSPIVKPVKIKLDFDLEGAPEVGEDDESKENSSPNDRSEGSLLADQLNGVRISETPPKRPISSCPTVSEGRLLEGPPRRRRRSGRRRRRRRRCVSCSGRSRRSWTCKCTSP